MLNPNRFLTINWCMLVYCAFIFQPSRLALSAHLSNDLQATIYVFRNNRPDRHPATSLKASQLPYKACFREVRGFQLIELQSADGFWLSLFTASPSSIASGLQSRHDDLEQQ
ncbi:TPA: hypothetical protein ACH3X3_004439 [Trebouxia sp. C0006]